MLTLAWSCLLALSLAAPLPGQPAALRPARLAFIRQALPQAERARQIAIEPARLSPADRNNDSYLAVYSADGRLLGYVRDFIGPVSPNQACPCNPLHLSLVLRPDLSLLTLLAPAPLQKWGHEAMSEAEFARLIGLMQALPAKLCAVPTVEDMVDAVSGATRQALADVVVHHAALSTRRIAGLLTDTRDIIRRTPIDRRRQALLDLLEGGVAAPARAVGLAGLVQSVREQGLRLQAFHHMVQAYTEALQGGSAALPAVEAAILNFAVLCEGGGNEVSAACLKIAATRRRRDFVVRCAAHLRRAGARGIAPHTAEHLLGTAYFMDLQFARALPLLLRAAQSRNAHDDPELFLRLAKAQVFTGANDAAQQTLRLLLRQAPRIPDGVATLQSAAGPASAAVLADIVAQVRQDFLRREVDLRQLGPALKLEDADGQPQSLELADPSRVTVAVFFATWCPHCRAELPALRDFVADIAARAPGSVRVVAVRTALEKETPAARAYWAKFAANFPVYTDADMSQAFAAFARATGRPTMLPTTAVIDRRGTLRYFIEPGLYRDIRAELHWATQAVGGAASD